MKTLEFENCGLQEMNVSEMKSVDGGLGNIFWFLLGVVASELNDRNSLNDFKEGFSAARN